MSTPSPSDSTSSNSASSSSSTTTSADSTIAEENLSEVVTTLILNAAIGLVLWALFEIKRNKRSVYAPRLKHLPHRTPPQLPYGPLRWIWPVARMPGPETLRFAGMDAYCLVRFNYLCLRICLFASFWGLVVLIPLYSYGSAEAPGIYVITLAHVESGSSLLWATVVFAYLFTWHALYVLKGEHQVFAEMREQFLTTGDPDFASQTRYTSKVESVPAELRSSVALEAYFDDLFPGQVHSAVMCLNMPKLERKVEKREKLADKLEKTRAIESATGKVLLHREPRFPLDCLGRQTGDTRADFLSQELRNLNDDIKKDQKAFLRSAQRLNAMDDRLMNDKNQDKGIGDGDHDANDASPAGGEGQGAGGVDVVAGENGVDETQGFVVRDTWPKERLDLFLSKKADVSSKWALEEEDLSDERDSDDNNDQSLSIDDTTRTDGIDEELQARRRRDSRSSPTLGRGPGPSPGDRPAIEGDKGTGVGGLIDAAPELAKEALSGLAFVGETAIHTTRRVARGVLYLALGQRMSTTGFVTFRQMTACASSRQVLLAPRPDWCQCSPAPDPRDVVWENIAVPLPQTNMRKRAAGILLLLGVIFWSFWVALIQAWASLSELEKIFPWLGNLDSDSIVYSLLSGYLPVVALLLLLLVLPFLFQMLSYRYEFVKSHSEVQQLVLERYFLYQMANIYVSVTSGSIIGALQSIVDDYNAIFRILGSTFPAVAVYFLDVIIVKTFAGLTFELLRGWPLIRVLWSQKFNKKSYATEREIRTGPFGEQSLLYGWAYPTLLLVLVVCFIYAVISPFIMPAGAIFFGFSYIVYKHQVLYVYVPKFESGGVFWFSVYPRVLVGLGLAQLTLTGYVFIKAGYYPGICLLPLPVMVYLYGNRSYKRYLGPAERVSLETAAKVDRRSNKAMSVATSGGGESNKLQERVVNPDEFESLMYAQLALTSPAIDPDDCRPGIHANSMSVERSPMSSGHAGSVSALQSLETPLLGSRAAARRGSSARGPGGMSSSSIRDDEFVDV